MGSSPVSKVPVQLAIKIGVFTGGYLDDNLRTAVVFEYGVPKRGHAEATLAKYFNPFEPEAIPVEEVNIVFDRSRLICNATMGTRIVVTKGPLEQLVLWHISGLIGNSDLVALCWKESARVVQSYNSVAAYQGRLNSKVISGRYVRLGLYRYATHD